MKKIIATLVFYSKKITTQFWVHFLEPLSIGIIREMEHWIGMRIVKGKLIDLNEHSTTLLEQISKNYQHPQKKSNFVCVSSSASAYNLTHNEVAANIEKCQKLSEARWKDELIEYICNH
jgi:gamma-glutamyl:cysteine ligase YbdK (ATP-grasp superfamily)